MDGTRERPVAVEVRLLIPRQFAWSTIDAGQASDCQSMNTDKERLFANCSGQMPGSCLQSRWRGNSFGVDRLHITGHLLIRPLVPRSQSASLLQSRHWKDHSLCVTYNTMLHL